MWTPFGGESRSPPNEETDQTAQCGVLRGVLWSDVRARGVGVSVCADAAVRLRDHCAAHGVGVDGRLLRCFAQREFCASLLSKVKLKSA